MKTWLVVLLLCAGFAGGQQKPAFDVVSIRRSDAAATNESSKALPGGHGYTAHNVAVTLMFSLMYKGPMRQISGGPEWLANDAYDVEARVDGAYSLDVIDAVERPSAISGYGINKGGAGA